jgi:hypothetical protein
MKTYDLPSIWSASKLIGRYNLNFNTDFYIDANGKLVVIPDFKITDDPPIFEPPDPPAVRQTKWTAGTPSKEPAGYTEIAPGKFVPYYS